MAPHMYWAIMRPPPHTMRREVFGSLNKVPLQSFGCFGQSTIFVDPRFMDEKLRPEISYMFATGLDLICTLKVVDVMQRSLKRFTEASRQATWWGI